VLLVTLWGPLIGLTFVLVVKRKSEGEDSRRMGVCPSGAANDREGELEGLIIVLSTNLEWDSRYEGLGAEVRIMV
jgi:hypothetical protein